jgi:hypothetical protein
MTKATLPDLGGAAKGDQLVRISEHNKSGHCNISDHSAGLDSWRLDLQPDFSRDIIAE